MIPSVNPIGSADSAGSRNIDDKQSTNFKPLLKEDPLKPIEDKEAFFNRKKREDISRLE